MNRYLLKAIFVVACSFVELPIHWTKNTATIFLPSFIPNPNALLIYDVGFELFNHYRRS